MNETHIPTLIMSVGIPASGKSTKIKEYRNKGYLILSSDVVRASMLGDGNSYPNDRDELTKLNNAVFESIKAQTAAAIKAGQSVVVDATNLNRKKRMGFLNSLGKTPCYKKCLLFITSREVCIERNASRNGAERVPDEAMEKMLKSFECPIYQEGWDEIAPVIHSTPYRFPFEQTVDLSQDNPHHTLTLHGHLSAAVEYAKSHNFPPHIQQLAYYHDTGKLYTKAFRNKRGEPTEFAHFYEHENYSAYLYLTEMCCGRECLTDEEFKTILHNTSVINCHMRPLNNWRASNSAKVKDTRLFGDKLIRDIELLNEADLSAH